MPQTDIAETAAGPRSSNNAELREALRKILDVFPLDWKRWEVQAQRIVKIAEAALQVPPRDPDTWEPKL